VCWSQELATYQTPPVSEPKNNMWETRMRLKDNKNNGRRRREKSHKDVRTRIGLGDVRLESSLLTIVEIMDGGGISLMVI